MKKGKNRRKLNDLGMSLIEILVAIAILAIVTGPILHSFVTAIKLNAKAKENQRATTAAQSIMEGFKAYNLEELCWQFYNSQGVADLSTSTTFYVVRNADRVYETDAVGNPVSSIDSLMGQFTANADNKYYFTLEGLDFEGRTYDAKVELEPLMSADIVAMKDVVVIQDFDVNTTAMYDQPNNLDIQVFNAIPDSVMNRYGQWKPDNLAYNGISRPEEEVRQMIIDNLKINEKTTTIIVGNAAGGWSANPIVTVYYKYGFSVEGCTVETEYGDYRWIDAISSDYVYLKEDGTVTFGEEQYTQIYPTPSTTNPYALETISFCYYPAYDYNLIGASGIGGISIPKEKIVISRWGRAINVSLIKQKNPIIASDVDLRTLEEKYMGTVEVDISQGWGGDVTTDGSNLTENLADAITSSPGGNMLNTKQDVLIYTVKISVYESGEAALGFTGEPLVVLDGTMND